MPYDRAKDAISVADQIAWRSVPGEGDIPQLLGFAVKAPIVAAFLDSNGIAYGTGSLGSRLDPADLAEHAKSVSVFITCRPRNDRISEGGGPDRRLGNERPIQPGLVRDER